MSSIYSLVIQFKSHYDSNDLAKHSDARLNYEQYDGKYVKQWYLHTHTHNMMNDFINSSIDQCSFSHYELMGQNRRYHKTLEVHFEKIFFWPQSIFHY